MATAKKTPPTAKPMATATPTAVPGDPAPGMRQVLQVISKRDGFRRAGREWHGTTLVPLDELTREQYMQIGSEPLLVAQLMEVPEEQVAEVTDQGSGEGTGT